MYDIQWAAGVHSGSERQQEAEDEIREVSEAGFSGLEVRSGWIESEEGIAKLRELFDAHQIALVSAVVPLSVVDSAGEKHPFDPFVIDRLDSLGAEYLVLTTGEGKSPSVAQEEMKQRAFKLDQISAYCEGLGMKATYQPSMEDLREEELLLKQLFEYGEGRWGLAPDLSLLAQLDRDPAGVIRSWGGRSNYLTLPAAGAGGGGPLETVAAALDEIQFSGWGTVRGTGERIPTAEDLAFLKRLFRM